MIFNEHRNLFGRHATLSPSNYHWINYSDDKMRERCSTLLLAAKGTELHDLASKAISLNVHMPDDGFYFNAYVNDALYYGMQPEVPLYFSENCFGTADCICFRDGLLRIHDLKTGVSKTSITQLLIYGAIFCLEYDIEPKDIEFEFRIYQRDKELQIVNPNPQEVIDVMFKIMRFDQIINDQRELENA